MAYQEGQLLDGRYRILRPISLGGMATTYLAVDTYSEEKVTIEVFQSSPEDQASLREVALLLNHPNILRTLHFGKEANNLYLISEYAPNGTLRQRHPRGSIVPLDTVISYTKQIASALQFVHDRGIIHRDVKPENMLLGQNNVVLLSDFGIATIISNKEQDASMIARPSAAGTLVYMAPEQFQGEPQPASDQYALAVVVYEWLSGKPPFSGSFMALAMKHLYEPPPSLRANVPTIPLDVEAVVLTALAKDPKQRFRSVRAFANALEQASKLGTFSREINPTMDLPRNSPTYSSSLPLSSTESPFLVRSLSAPLPLSLPSGSASDDDDDTMFATPPSPPPPPPSAPRSSPGLSSFFIEAGNALASLFSGRGRKKQQETQLSLFAIAHTTLEYADRAIVGKVYTAQAGISQSRPENFRSEPFRVSVQNPTEPLLFDILLHPSVNIELMEGRFRRLRYDPRNPESQFTSFPFRLKAPGRSYLLINFYRERQWLKTMRFEFDGIDQSVLASGIYG